MEVTDRTPAQYEDEPPGYQHPGDELIAVPVGNVIWLDAETYDRLVAELERPPRVLPGLARLLAA